MNGVTGRMGANQHLARSIMAIRRQGGIPIGDGEAIWPEPILVGRSEAKLRALAAAHGLERWTTDLDACLADPAYPVYFDAQTTSERAAAVRAAIRAGKHVYCEKPVAQDLETAMELVRLARGAGIKNGVVQDKLFLPGLRKLRRLKEAGYFGRLLAARGEFGYWVFEGDWQPSQRPSWNYRAEAGGGIVLDMFAHWRYVLDQVVAPVRAVSALHVTHIPERVDERGARYQATADDAAFGTFELEGGAVAQINSSWAVRVFRADLFTLQVDGTEGSAVAGLRECWAQHRSTTPRPVWNPDVPREIDYQEGWQEVPDNGEFENGFKAEWELFLRHVVCDEPFAWSLLEGAKGVQLAELAMRSSAERRWVSVPELEP
ncbi:MAG: Gfo/Idh/MocA family oxidoreductase [Candidatus Dormibacteraeota bacterium]|nr:Gfo/Idh/MocA family oxidoreductase [Candidatus Dormibacteraeota bacterium]